MEINIDEEEMANDASNQQIAPYTDYLKSFDYQIEDSHRQIHLNSNIQKHFDDMGDEPDDSASESYVESSSDDVNDKSNRNLQEMLQTHNI